MTAASQQIVSAYETAGMTPEEIAADQELELMAVKSVLMQFSSAYKKAVRKGDEDIEFNEEEHQMAKDVISTIARYSEDERLKLKAAMYIRDDKKGRLDVAKNALGAVNFNVIAFNEIMQKAIAAKNRSKGITDVKAEVTVETPC